MDAVDTPLMREASLICMSVRLSGLCEWVVRHACVCVFVCVHVCNLCITVPPTICPTFRMFCTLLHICIPIG